MHPAFSNMSPAQLANFGAIEAAAVAGTQCPQNRPLGPLSKGIVGALARYGFIALNLNNRHQRVATILVGPNAGKSTAAVAPRTMLSPESCIRIAAMFKEGCSISVIARETDFPPLLIDRALRRFRLQPPTIGAKSEWEEDCPVETRKRIVRGDFQFCAAMRKAIDAGLETPPAAASPTGDSFADFRFYHPVPTHSGCSSPAGTCVDW